MTALTSINVDLTKKNEDTNFDLSTCHSRPHTNLTNSNAYTTASIIGTKHRSAGYGGTYPLGSNRVGACVLFVGFIPEI